MRAFRAHSLIVAMLCLLGVITWMFDYQQDLGGDWFPRFGFTRLIWMGIGLYALVSSVLVFLVWIPRASRNSCSSTKSSTWCEKSSPGMVSSGNA